MVIEHSKATILAVDDNPDNLLVLKELTENLLPECNLVTADNAAQGLIMVKEHLPDVALIDVQMPGMDGLEMCRRIKADTSNHHFPIILVTAHATGMDIKTAGLAAGADDFITKPIENAELAAKVNVMLRIKRSEDELREINVRLEDMVEQRTKELRDSLQTSVDIVLAIPSGLLIYDFTPPNTLVLRAGNPAAEAQCGIKLEDHCGKAFDEIWPGARGLGLTDALLNVVRTGETYVNECFHYQQGAWDDDFMIHAFCMPHQRLGVAFENITERKRAQEALETSQRNYRYLVENATDMICSLDLDGKITYASPAFLKTLGYAHEELLGKGAGVVVVPEDRSRVLYALNIEHKNKPSASCEFSLLKKSGESVPVEAVSNPVYSTSGGVVGTQAILRDVSIRRELEEQLRHAQKMEAVGRLAGGVAHDFNNILTLVSGYSELALNRMGSDHPCYKEIEEIRKAGERAATLTRQLLAFSRKQVLQPDVLDLNALIADLEKMLRRLIGEDLELTIIPGNELGSVRADPGQIEQVIMNLAVNSRDAMPQGGKLIIETANICLDETYTRDRADMAPGEYVLITVRDTGVGMSSEVLSHIFDPFFTTKDLGKGTGLGLSTVYGIIKQSGGHIAAHSEPGAGTTFKVYLPRVRGTVSRRPARDHHHEILTGAETVLLVEDDDVVRVLTLRILKEHGYNVLEARHGGDALLLCEKNQKPIDLLITDAVMPGVSGGKLAKYLTSLRPQMKVLCMSGYVDSPLFRGGLLESDMPFLQKPFTPAQLTRKVREVLDAM